MIENAKRDHLKHITESIPEYFFVYDVDKNIFTYLSDSFQKYKASDIEGADMEQMRDMIHYTYQDAFDEIFDKIQQGHLVQDEDLRMINKDGAEKWISVKTHAITSEKSRLVAGHVMDITKRVLINSHLKKEAGELEQIIHIMAHDLRSPLGSIRNILELQKGAFGENNIASVETYTNMASRIANDMNTTIESMIEMIELSSEKFILQKAFTNISGLVHTITENFSYDLAHKKISFQNYIPENDIFINIDPIKCRLVIQNLLSNAIKFTNVGGNIELQVLDDPDHVAITVADNGVGIPEDKIEVIFEKFTPMKRKGTSGERSTGLGLSIVKKIVEIHGGTIEVESKENEGTTFIVTLPREF